MNPYKILVTPARRWFGGRSQWKFAILAPNGVNLSDRDTYANVGDIQDAMQGLVNSGTQVVLEVHYRNGRIETDQLR